METGHRAAELPSIELHRLVAERLDEAAVVGARQRVERWLDDDGPVHPEYARRWLKLLSLPIPEIAAALTEDSPDMRDLRQNSPFAGTLPHSERLAALQRISGDEVALPEPGKLLFPSSATLAAETPQSAALQATLGRVVLPAW
jgi:hypothetical protein